MGHTYQKCVTCIIIDKYILHFETLKIENSSKMQFGILMRRLLGGDDSDNSQENPDTNTQNISRK